MPDLATKNVVVTEATHERLTAIKDANDLASFDRLIMRALDAFEANNCISRQTPEPPQDAPTSPA